ncbi:hypothetical protein J8J27_27300, partial [Mycobacterium tuberculosis]|nr:hypothetical protein [Mycobacterium tuberculosis]
IGYRFNEWLRADITAEYRAATDLNGIGEIIQADNTDYMSKHTAKLDSWVFLANLYADLGTYNSLTPYVGAGIGVAGNRMYDAKQTTISYS